MQGQICLSAFVFMAIGLFGITAKAQEGKGLWGVKPVPLDIVLHKAQFQVVLPKPLPSQFSLQKAEIAWVQPYDDASRGHFPARQMICLFYKIQGKGTMALIETKVLSGNVGMSAHNVDPTDPCVYQAVGEGYFFDKIKVGTILNSGFIKGIAFVIVGQSKEDLQALQDSLSGPMDGKVK